MIAVATFSLAGVAPAYADPVPVDAPASDSLTETPDPNEPKPVEIVDGIPIWDEDDPEVPAPVEPGSDPNPTDDPLWGVPDRPDRAPDNCTPKTSKSVNNNVKNDYKETFLTGMRNNTGDSIPFDVTVTETDTVTYGLSVTVEEDFKAWIFAKIKASVNANVSKSMTTQYGLTVHPTVRPHHKITVQYGVSREKVSFRRWQTYRDCSQKTTKTGTAWAPYSKDFRISTKKI